MFKWFLKRRLRKFLQTRPDSSGLVLVRDMARKFPNPSATMLATALFELKEEGLVEMRFQLVRPDGSIMGWSFLDPRDIPETIYDMELDKQVLTSPMDITVAFVVNPYV
jgi:hypothetical protein